MGRTAIVFFVVGLLSLSFALDYPESEWKLVGETDGSRTIDFTLALRLQNLDTLNELTKRLTTPGSPEYRQWKTIEELNAITRPDRIQVKNLMSLLAEFGMEAVDYGDFIKAKGNAKKVEDLFQVTLYSYRNRIFNDITISRSLQMPQIPRGFDSLILFVTGIANFPHPTRSQLQTDKRITEEARMDDRNLYMVPTTLRNQYNVPYDYIANNTKSSQAVVEFSVRSGVTTENLQNFMIQTDGILRNVSISYTVGPFDANAQTGEALLDLEYIMGMAPGVPTAYYVINGWMYDFTTLISIRAQNNLSNPYVFSVSYGYLETKQCAVTGNGEPCSKLGGDSETYIAATEIGFQKMGLMGISVFAASGDAGSECSIITNQCYGLYPACSDYVTAVGGTKYQNATVLRGSAAPPFCQDHDCAASGYEVVCEKPSALIISGGGFSSIVPKAAWQANQVQQYLATSPILPPTSSFNSSGRAWPDISGLAHKYMIYIGGRKETDSIDGTSASSPVVAALFSLINDALFNIGKPSLGFLNPTLYELIAEQPQVVFDVILGDNINVNINNYGYGATPGWDATTGFGTPNWQAMKDALLEL